MISFMVVCLILLSCVCVGGGGGVWGYVRHDTIISRNGMNKVFCSSS